MDTPVNLAAYLQPTVLATAESDESALTNAKYEVAAAVVVTPAPSPSSKKAREPGAPRKKYTAAETRARARVAEEKRLATERVDACLPTAPREIKPTVPYSELGVVRERPFGQDDLLALAFAASPSPPPTKMQNGEEFPPTKRAHPTALQSAARIALLVKSGEVQRPTDDAEDVAPPTPPKLAEQKVRSRTGTKNRKSAPRVRKPKALKTVSADIADMPQGAAPPAAAATDDIRRSKKRSSSASHDSDAESDAQPGPSDAAAANALRARIARAKNEEAMAMAAAAAAAEAAAAAAAAMNDGSDDEQADVEVELDKSDAAESYDMEEDDDGGDDAMGSRAKKSKPNSDDGEPIAPVPLTEQEAAEAAEAKAERELAMKAEPLLMSCTTPPPLGLAAEDEAAAEAAAADQDEQSDVQWKSSGDEEHAQKKSEPTVAVAGAEPAAATAAAPPQPRSLARVRAVRRIAFNVDMAKRFAGTDKRKCVFIEKLMQRARRLDSVSIDVGEFCDNEHEVEIMYALINAVVPPRIGSLTTGPAQREIIGIGETEMLRKLCACLRIKFDDYVPPHFHIAQLEYENCVYAALGSGNEEGALAFDAKRRIAYFWFIGMGHKIGMPPVNSQALSDFKKSGGRNGLAPRCFVHGVTEFSYHIDQLTQRITLEDTGAYNVSFATAEHCLTLWLGMFRIPFKNMTPELLCAPPAAASFYKTAAAIAAVVARDDPSDE